MATLDDKLDYIIGATAAKKLFEAFGITTVGHLLRHYPRHYADGASICNVSDTRAHVGDHITVVDTIRSVQLRTMNKLSPSGNKREYLVISLGTGANRITATFFNPHRLKAKLIPNTRVMLSGEVHYFNGTLQLTHPDFLILDSRKHELFGSASLRNIAASSRTIHGDIRQQDFECATYPIYPATTQLQSWDIFACIRQVLNVLDPIEDPLPESLRHHHQLMDEDQALRTIHLGQCRSERDRARYRLLFDEAIALQWALIQRRNTTNHACSPSAFPRLPPQSSLVGELTHQLPFNLTEGQQHVLQTLSEELSGSKPMSRLLHGEVGSGKTVIALLAMLQMVDAGYQCVLLAPTEVLAEQHAQSIRQLLGPLGRAGQLDQAEHATAITLLTGTMSASAKKQARQMIQSGEAGIVIGTHALLTDSVTFHNLGFVVVDEQHRFGVDQRDRLRAKAPHGITPHLLIMTATPIPRTVALTAYGDLDVSVLHELPRGRQPIMTSVICTKEKPAWLQRAWQRIREEVQQGRQVYIVAPRIDEADTKGLSSSQLTRGSETAVGLYHRLSTGELAGLRLGLMHGKLTKEQKDTVMSDFRAGSIDVLVCTTVIEVGVDVPNATVMFIASAEWFGISQLHQLRGRIGRGQHPGLCLLATSLGSSSRSAQRLQAVAESCDGFQLAELDLRTRGEGDILGRDQSGFHAGGLKLLSLVEHGEIIDLAHQFCTHHWHNHPHDRQLERLVTDLTNDQQMAYLDKT